MSGIDGLGQLELLVEWLGTLAPRVKGKGLEQAAAALQKTALKEYAAGKGPHGVKGPWPARKKDGAVALQRPAAELQFQAKGGAIRSSTADEPVLDHHRGKRPVYPQNGAPPPATWVQTIEDSIEVFLEGLEKEAPK